MAAHQSWFGDQDQEKKIVSESPLTTKKKKNQTKQYHDPSLLGTARIPRAAGAGAVLGILKDPTLSSWFSDLLLDSSGNVFLSLST